MNKISAAFKNKKIFIPFITCGYPDFETTKKCIFSLIENGAGIIELGIPFSDPTAEGPTIQEANLKALQGGVTTEKIFDFVKKIRGEIKIPLIFMTYANVVFGYGTEKFLKNCAEIGIDGIILPDVPFEEKNEFLPTCKKFGINLISMIAPTSEDRIAKISSEAEGFLYIVSSLGVTGTRTEITTNLSPIIKIVRENTKIPCAIGFGISNADQAKKMSELADGVIIGSAIIKIISKYGKNSPEKVGEFAKTITDSI